jgi:hypothetical protein
MRIPAIFAMHFLIVVKAMASSMSRAPVAFRRADAIDPAVADH